MELDAVVCGDCLDVMTGIPDSCIDLVFADYPFSYSRNGWDVPQSKTYDLINKTIPEFKRILRANSSAYLVFGFSTCGYAERCARDNKLSLVNWIVWRFDVGYHPTKRFKNRAYHILWFSNGDEWVFNGNDVRIPHRTQDKRNNPNGAIPSDVWVDIPELKKNSYEFVGHNGQKPERLLERIIKASSNPDDLIFDPFIGSGTTAVAAIKTGRHFYGCDINQEYVDTTNQRIKKVRSEMRQMELAL